MNIVKFSRLNLSKTETQEKLRNETTVKQLYWKNINAKFIIPTVRVSRGDAHEILRVYTLFYLQGTLSPYGVLIYISGFINCPSAIYSKD